METCCLRLRQPDLRLTLLNYLPYLSYETHEKHEKLNKNGERDVVAAVCGVVMQLGRGARALRCRDARLGWTLHSVRVYMYF